MIERYDPIGRTEKFCGQAMIDIRAMYERGYSDGKNDTIEANRESEYKRGFEDGMESIKNNYSADAEAAYKRGYENGMSVVKDNFNADEEGAYQRGYEDGRKSNEVTLKTDGTITAPSQSVLGVAAAAIADDKMGYKHGYNDGYQRGLDDMRDAMLAISKWDNDYRAKVFHGNFGTLPIMREHEAKYIVDQVQRYQEEQAAQTAEIKVGDEVIWDDVRGIVTRVEDTFYVVVCSDGSTGCWNRNECNSTGRHYAIMTEIFEKLKEGET